MLRWQFLFSLFFEEFLCFQLEQSTGTIFPPRCISKPLFVVSNQFLKFTDKNGLGSNPGSSGLAVTQRFALRDRFFGSRDLPERLKGEVYASGVPGRLKGDVYAVGVLAVLFHGCVSW